MMIDWNAFAPALAGGLLIGMAAVVLMAFNGRIAGISGILGNLLPWKAKESDWRLAFIAGLLAAPLLWQLALPLPAMDIQAGNGLLIVAGLLVGFGTRMASGCTSGHAVCGLSRLSWRSLAATLTFMLAAILTVFISRHLLGG